MALRDLYGAGEAGLTMGTGLLGAVPAGLWGLLNLPRGSEEATQAIEDVQRMLTYEPRTMEGQAAVRALGDAGEVLDMPFRYVGDVAAEQFGPAAGAAAYTGAQMIPVGGLLKSISMGPMGDLGPTVGAMGRQRGAMPVGGPPQVGLLGKKLPQTTDTLQKLMEDANYQLGSAPGMYT